MRFIVAVAIILTPLLVPEQAPAQDTRARFEALAARATAAREANQVEQAVGAYREAVQINAGWAEGWFYLGTLLYDSDQYASGRDALRRFVKLQPGPGPAWGLLGLCEFETGETSPALADIRKSLSQGPAESPQMDAVLRYHEALLLARTGESDEAIQKYVWFARNTPVKPPLLLAVGIAALRAPLLPKDVPAGRRDLFLAAGQAAIYAMQGDGASAERALQDLLTRFPKAPGVHYLRGSFLLGSAPAEAMEEFRQELAAGASPAAESMLAWVLLNRGDAAGALPHARRAATGATITATAHYVLGRSLTETGNLIEGIPHLESAVKLDPANLEARMSLASAYSRAGRTKEAREERTRAVTLAREVAPVLRN